MSIKEIGAKETIRDYFTMLIGDARTSYKDLGGFDRSTVDYYLEECTDILKSQGVVRKVEGDLSEIKQFRGETRRILNQAGYCKVEEL